MNPPFSASANVDRRIADAPLRHIASALARLSEGGRLVTITGASFEPDNPTWTEAFVRLQDRGRVVFSAAVDGSVYAKHDRLRLTVIDKPFCKKAGFARSACGESPGRVGQQEHGEPA